MRSDERKCGLVACSQDLFCTFIGNLVASNQATYPESQATSIYNQKRRTKIYKRDIPITGITTNPKKTWTWILFSADAR
jgi:hypothetical protein